MGGRLGVESKMEKDNLVIDLGIIIEEMRVGTRFIKFDYCPACKKGRIFQYHGPQKMSDSRIAYYLYDCFSCGDTKAFDHTKDWEELRRNRRLNRVTQLPAKV